MNVAERLFWFFLAVIFYAYAGYPCLVWFASLLFRKGVKKGPYEPSVSLILSAYNEEGAIERKLLNLLNLDYPEDKLEILVGSDGASDQTDQVVARFRSPRIRFFRFVANLGKPHVLNMLAQEARSPILVFTDARQELDRGSIRALVENFHDPEIGGVSGELHFVKNSKVAMSRGMNAYWNYEKFLRKCESAVASALGATGALYAVRRRLYRPIPWDMLVDDMYLPLSIVAKGYRVIFDSWAKVFDEPSKAGGQELKRKVRTLAGNFQIFQIFPELLNPFKSPVAWQLFSHKFLRLIVPYLLFVLLFINAFLLNHSFYRGVFILQILFYSLALIEAVQKTRKGIGFIPYTFCLLNYSALVALFRFLKGKQKGTWEKAYA